MTVSNNRFGLFGGSAPQTSNGKLRDIDNLIAQHHQTLLKKASPEFRAQLLHSFHQAKPPTTEKYLQQFINDFQNNKTLAETVKFYRQKLAEYQQAKQQANTAAVNASLAKQKQIAEAPKLTPQALDWQQLIETLKCSVNRCATSGTLSWHPDHKENYYLAKLHVLWHQYQEKYDEIILYNFAKSLGYEITEERRQAVISSHLEALQNLMHNKMQYTPTRLANRQKQLELEKNKQLTEINALTPQFIEYAKEIIEFALQPIEAALSVYHDAIREIKLQKNVALSSNPTLFNKLKTSKRYRPYEFSTLKKIPADEMETYYAIFAKITGAALEETNKACPAA